MVPLPNNCRVGNFSVFPKNWEDDNADIKLTWRITYWFYDDNLKQKKQLLIKGMNSCKNRKARQIMTRKLQEDELYELQIKMYNPILNKYFKESRKVIYEISKQTQFSEALTFALTKEKETRFKADTARYTNNAISAATYLRFEYLAVSEIELKHLMLIFDRLAEQQDKWSDNQHNCHRKALVKVFKTLKRYGAVIANFPEDIPIKKGVKKFRETLEDNQLKKIFNHLRKSNYTFWRFSNIFFHSGCRESELMRLQAKDVDLDKREFLITVYKGDVGFEDLRAITPGALPYWKEIMAEVGSPNDYIFSKKLRPGPDHINPIQIPRRWRNQVKIPFKTDVDFYALKHLYLDKVAAKVDIYTAQGVAGHTTVKTTKKYYTKNEKSRELEKVKNIKIAI